MNPTSIKRRWLGALALVVATAGASAARAADEGFSAGLSVQPGASAAAIGLPFYPGAVPERDRDGSGEGASINLWGGAFGLELHAVKLLSDDSVDTVARFYREAMARQGRVLDCASDAPPEPPPAASGSKLMRCDKDRAKPGGQLLKVAVPGGVRMVAIEPAAGRTRIQLVRLMLRGE